jgi:hypothetical protein
MPPRANLAAMGHTEEKTCKVCGRAIQWRKKWEKDWDAVKYCSQACRKRGINDTDRALESAILDLLSRRASGSTLCPSEAARQVDPEQWRALMEPARMAARRLHAQGKLRVQQKGHDVEPSDAKGPIRLRLAGGG